MHRNGIVTTSAALSPKHHHHQQQQQPRAPSSSGFLHHHQQQHKKVSSSVVKAASSEHVVVPTGVEFPGSYLATGKFGRGLFSNGSSQDVPLTSTPLNVCACVPEDVISSSSSNSKLSPSQRDRVREFYREWMNGLGIPSIPENLIKFATECPMPKDMRIAVIVAWLTKNSEEWKMYKRETLPKTYDSLYLANEKELEELQDVSVMNMAKGSAKMYEAQMEQLLKEPLFNSEGVKDMIEVEDLQWARSVAHTRAMSGKLIVDGEGSFPCAFVVPGADLTNHRTVPNSNYGVSEDGLRYELKWRSSELAEEEEEGLPPVPEEERKPKEGLEMFISYGVRHPNALLALHYGFVDDTNPNDRIPMECVVPGMRKVPFKVVMKAVVALKENGDDRAAWAGSQLLAVSMRSPEGVPNEIADQEKVDPEIVEQMKKATVAALSQFPTTLEDDEKIETGAIKSSRMQVAISYRIAQKRHLHAYQRFLDTL